MIIRDVLESDKLVVDQIWRKHYASYMSLPGLKHSVTSAVVEHNGIVAGYGVVNLWAEGTFIIDKDMPLKQRVFATQLLTQRGIDACKHYDIDVLHVSVKKEDENFISIMNKHFNFTQVNDIILAKETKNGR